MIEFKKNQVIFHEKDVCDALYIISSGRVLALQVVNNRVIPLKVVGAHGFLGESSLVGANTTWGVTAIALDSTQIERVDRKDIVAYIKQSPGWLKKVFETLSTRIRKTHDLLGSHGIVDSTLSGGLNVNPELEVTIKNSIKGYLAKRSK